jgi:hypothetical protein
VIGRLSDGAGIVAAELAPGTGRPVFRAPAAWVGRAATAADDWAGAGDWVGVELAAGGKRRGCVPTGLGDIVLGTAVCAVISNTAASGAVTPFGQGPCGWVSGRSVRLSRVSTAVVNDAAPTRPGASRRCHPATQRWAAAHGDCAARVGLLTISRHAKPGPSTPAAGRAAPSGRPGAAVARSPGSNALTVPPRSGTLSPYTQKRGPGHCPPRQALTLTLTLTSRLSALRPPPGTSGHHWYLTRCLVSRPRLRGVGRNRAD